MIETKGQHLRVRVRDPEKYTDFRTDDVGDKGHTQRIVGYSKKTGWQTQSWIFPIEDVKTRRPKTMIMLRKLKVTDNMLKKAGV